MVEVFWVSWLGLKSLSFVVILGKFGRTFGNWFQVTVMPGVEEGKP